MGMKIIIFVLTFMLSYFGGAILLCVDSGQSPNSIPKFCSVY